ncbi:MAG TPA: hypothetical protein VFU88_02210 [Ktedonobacterales bacterium]|nr:hypothetical protein [Ktedonobacterales bacterium]
MAATRTHDASSRAAGYPLLGRLGSRAEWVSRIIALAAGLGMVFVYRLYLRSDDVAPDSVAGLIFASFGTGMLALVGLGYVVRKRIRRHAARRLHEALAWHIAGAMLGVLLIFLHAAGNFNPRSGTYALWGLIAVAVSGVIGRLIDRLCPRLAAAAAARAMTAEGEERLVVTEQKAEEAPAHSTSQRKAIGAATSAAVPWDLAYYDLDPEVETIPHLLTPPARKDASTRGVTGAWRSIAPRTAQVLRSHRPLGRLVKRELAAARSAAGRERLYIQMIRVWRRVHMLTCIVALGLLGWHIEFAITLYMNAH